MSANPRFTSLLNKMAAIHNKKNEDYASASNPYSNFEFAAKVSALFASPVDQVFATLIGVKLARLGELCGKGKTPNNESIQDTFLDLATYATIWGSYYEPALSFKGIPFSFDKAETKTQTGLGLTQFGKAISQIEQPQQYPFSQPDGWSNRDDG